MRVSELRQAVERNERRYEEAVKELDQLRCQAQKQEETLSQMNTDTANQLQEERERARLLTTDLEHKLRHLNNE
jgi:hypothetical protein